MIWGHHPKAMRFQMYSFHFSNTHHPILLDVPAWFRSLRLHKYNNIFEPMKWQDIVKLSDEDLIAKGVAALGARRKMLKVFETIRQHCEDNVSHQKKKSFQWTLPEDPS
jgi:hypothetical protein